MGIDRFLKKGSIKNGYAIGGEVRRVSLQNSTSSSINDLDILYLHSMKSNIFKFHLLLNLLQRNQSAQSQEFNWPCLFSLM